MRLGLLSCNCISEARNSTQTAKYLRIALFATDEEDITTGVDSYSPIGLHRIILEETQLEGGLGEVKMQRRETSCR